MVLLCALVFAGAFIGCSVEVVQRFKPTDSNPLTGLYVYACMYVCICVYVGPHSLIFSSQHVLRYLRLGSNFLRIWNKQFLSESFVLATRPSADHPSFKSGAKKTKPWR